MNLCPTLNRRAEAWDLFLLNVLPAIVIAALGAILYLVSA